MHGEICEKLQRTVYIAIQLRQKTASDFSTPHYIVVHDAKKTQKLSSIHL